jgi:quercetin dioxygenase-like cupin family protein
MKTSLIAATMVAALSATPTFAADASFHISAAAAKTQAADGYNVKSFVFEPGTIKVITFDAAKPKAYPLTDEVQFYVLSGAVSTDVSGASVELAAGDMATRPTGTIRPKAGAGATTVVAHKVRSSSSEPKPGVVRATEVQDGLAVQWMQDGKPMSATTEEAAKAAPAGAGRFIIRRYAFDGNSIRVVSLTKGGRTNSTAYQTYNIIYLTKGKMKRNVGDQSVEVKAGDAIVEQTGTTGYWDILEDSQFVSTTAIMP